MLWNEPGSSKVFRQTLSHHDVGERGWWIIEKAQQDVQEKAPTVDPHHLNGIRQQLCAQIL